MTFDQLVDLSEKNEVRIDSHRGFKRIPPHYHYHLRNALEAYFNTFYTKNQHYEYYAQGLANQDMKISARSVLDENNTVLTIVGFEQFFELFLKDLLRRVNPNLIYKSKKKLKIETIIKRIEEKNFEPKRFKRDWQKVNFSETINRYYQILALIKHDKAESSVLKKFKRLSDRHSFLNSDFNRDSLKLLNWYRNRILHYGNRLPSLWLLDYLATQRIIPMISEILSLERKNLADFHYYLTTPTGLNLIKEFQRVQFDFNDLKDSTKQKQVFEVLLFIGHLKEMGRASLRIMPDVRRNIKAPYEYNYRDPIGRGKRFANAEREYKDFKWVSDCPCCGVQSLVVYSLPTQIPGTSETLNIEWVKCYTCEYHMRFNAGDPQFFNLANQIIFDWDEH